MFKTQKLSKATSTVQNINSQRINQYKKIEKDIKPFYGIQYQFSRKAYALQNTCLKRR